MSFSDPRTKGGDFIVILTALHLSELKGDTATNRLLAEGPPRIVVQRAVGECTRAIEALAADADLRFYIFQADWES